MYLFTIAATPKPENEGGKDIEGAFVTALIDFIEEKGAEAIARLYIEGSGWNVEEINDTTWIDEKNMVPDHEHYQDYLEAKETGAYLMFRHWKKKTEEPQTKH